MSPGPRTHLRLTASIVAFYVAGCIDRQVGIVAPHTQSGVVQTIDNAAIDKVDLLLEVDNSNSMVDNQANIMAQFGLLIRTLTDPPCTSATNPTPHACNPSDPSDQRQYPPVHDLHVGIIDQDLGTPGSGICGSDVGDDGLLNPIHFGAAMQTHEPWTSRPGQPAAPAGFRPADCTASDEFPSFLSFDSGTTDANTFEHDFRCNAGLWVYGCGLEAQLEAAWRTLVWRDASDHAGNDNANAGFLRDDALLAIVLLTDEEDGSVRDCRYAHGTPCDPTGSDPNPLHNDATDVYQLASTRWGATSDLNLRFYNYRPGGAMDPTWPLERYIDPHDATRGFLALKPGHPERVVFAAITGVPLEIPTRTDDQGETHPDWDALLGAPDPNDPENFYGRDSSSAIDTDTPEGHISMRAANIDPNWSCGSARRLVPACRRMRSAQDLTLQNCGSSPPDPYYFAWPSRRIVEVARRFDESPLCNGRACHNGLVTSICSSDYTSAMQAIVSKIQSRLVGRCLFRALQTTTDPDTGDVTVPCTARETLPPGLECAQVPGRQPALDDNGTAIVTHDADGTAHAVCTIAQVPVGVDGQPIDGMPGWYYDRAPHGPDCQQSLEFTAGAEPPPGAIAQLSCIEQVANGPSQPTH